MPTTGSIALGQSREDLGYAREVLTPAGYRVPWGHSESQIGYLANNINLVGVRAAVYVDTVAVEQLFV